VVRCSLKKSEKVNCDVYLDIETTGLSPFGDTITVIGIYRCNGSESEVIQLVGDAVTVNNLLQALEGADTIYTYNGQRFDLNFIKASLGIDLEDLCKHEDLMFACWRNNLYGGFKAVERQLGIPRKLQGISGYDAVLLWWRYVEYGDLNALATLLEYNNEDVVNLKMLRERLDVFELYIQDEEP